MRFLFSLALLLSVTPVAALDLDPEFSISIGRTTLDDYPVEEITMGMYKAARDLETRRAESGQMTPAEYYAYMERRRIGLEKAQQLISTPTTRRVITIEEFHELNNTPCEQIAYKDCD